MSGQITGSMVAAGLDPVDNTFGDGDHRLAGTAAASVVRTLTARGADDASRFLAGQFGKARLGAKVNPASDPRFRILQ